MNLLGACVLINQVQNRPLTPTIQACLPDTDYTRSYAEWQHSVSES